MPRDASEPARPSNRRSRGGCLPCRQTRTKKAAVCNSCQERGEACRWNARGGHQATDIGRESPMDVSGGSNFSLDIPCNVSATPGPTASGLGTAILALGPKMSTPDSTPVSMQDGPIPDLKDLVRLYFATVHHFGYLSFIHEADFWELEEQGRAPKGLSLLMAAHALRFSGHSVESERLKIADQWVIDVGENLNVQVMSEFGAIELMEVVLCQTYEFLNGRYSRGMVMAGMAVRMMTFLRLHELDEWPRQAAKPLLGRESLRRLAWSVWFLDATLDGGVFGASTIHEDAFTIQLPCDERPFLLHKQVTTEPLLPTSVHSQVITDVNNSETLDMSAHLLRAMCARQALALTHSRIQRRMIQAGNIVDAAHAAEHKANSLLDTLTPDLKYSRSLYHIYRERRPSLVLLHVVRNNCQRHRTLLRMLVVQHVPGASYETSLERRALIASARSLCQILADALDYDVALDPQIAMHAYNAIEILLFQPTRLAMEHSESPMSREEILRALDVLVQVVRRLARVCSLVALIYPEAINRMIQMGYVDGLTDEDILAVLQKIHCITNADKEFDWTESFWRYEIFLARRARIAQENARSNAPPKPPASNHADPSPESPEDALLEVPAQLQSTSSAIIDLAPIPPMPVDSSLSTLIGAHRTTASFDIGSHIPPARQGEEAAGPISRLHHLFATPGSALSGPDTVAYLASRAPSPSANDSWPTALMLDPNGYDSFSGVDNMNGVFPDINPASGTSTPKGQIFPLPWG
ncbi:hypothetical protein IAR55_005592 [Kwoniella newhampshirensis]|uniref:Xylanolytic transcriptional activator regulatory domain-containing protein n=1 Tax=Kwoniella newhampshirensis TaxID=1651941 RepID=A0AAW0YUG4_9TREE